MIELARLRIASGSGGRVKKREGKVDRSTFPSRFFSLTMVCPVSQPSDFSPRP
jgi:hypothetical protein